MATWKPLRLIKSTPIGQKIPVGPNKAQDVEGKTRQHRNLFGWVFAIDYDDALCPLCYIYNVASVEFSIQFNSIGSFEVITCICVLAIARKTVNGNIVYDNDNDFHYDSWRIVVRKVVRVYFIHATVTLLLYATPWCRIRNESSEHAEITQCDFNYMISEAVSDVLCTN